MKKYFASVVLALCLIFGMGAGISALPQTAIEVEAAGNLNGVCKGANGNWYYYKNGKIVRTNTVAKNKNGWWVIQNGKVNFKYTGFAKNSSGWWYCKGGKVQFGTNSIIKGKVNGTNAWWHVVKGKVKFDTTVAKNKNGWYYIQKGKVNFNANTVARNSNGWWVIQKGKVNFKYNGFAKNSSGWWYCKGGKVQFGTNSIIKGKVNGTNAWWHVVKGKVTYDTTVAKNSNGWYYIKKGKVDFGFNGIASNSSGSWYCKKGKVDFNYSGTYKSGEYTYTIKKGKVVKTVHKHVHTYTEDYKNNAKVKDGIACNTCYKDLTDWEDPFACHLGWHTHWWYLTPDTVTCNGCGKKLHIHTWRWREPIYYTGTDEITGGGYYHCLGCGADTRDTNGKLVDIDKWTTEYDFTGSDYIILNGKFPDKGNVWELQDLHFKMDKERSSLTVGEKAALIPVYTPASTNTDKTLKWTSSDPSVATVKNGVVTAVAPGKTTITATSKNGISETKEFTVTKASHAVTDFSILVDGKDQTDKTISLKKDQLYTIQIVPKGASAPRYVAEIKEVGYAELYHGTDTFSGIFSIANYDTSVKYYTEIPGWDGKLNIKFQSRPKNGKNADVTIKVKDEEGHIKEHKISVNVVLK